VKLDQTYFDKNIELAFMTASRPLFDQKTHPSLLLGNQVGNMYTPSLYGGLVSHLVRYIDEMRILFTEIILIFTICRIEKILIDF